MTAEHDSGTELGYQLLADRFTDRYDAYNSFWQDVEGRWQADDEENRVQFAPISRTVSYADMDGYDQLTVEWKDGSAVLVSYLGTEDEMWDFADNNPRVRGFRFESVTNNQTESSSDR